MVSRLSAVLFPPLPRRVPWERGVNIALRCAHLMTSSILLGGHVFAVPPSRLFVYLLLSIVSGAGLILLELYRSCRWIYLAKGVLVLPSCSCWGRPPSGGTTGSRCCCWSSWWRPSARTCRPASGTTP
jgi:hypothetical protein